MVAVVFKTSIILKMNSTKRFRSYEHMDMTMKSSSKSLRIVIVYRPPPSKANNLNSDIFFSEFSSFLEHMAPGRGKGEVLITVDFNFYMHDENDILDKIFMQLIHYFDYTQNVNSTSTHKGIHTLDLIITRSGDKIVTNTFVIDPVISDHYAVSCKLLLEKPPHAKKGVTYRSLQAIDFQRFRDDIKNCGLIQNLSSLSSLEDCVDLYENSLTTRILDIHAPVKKRVKAEIRKDKVNRRCLERRRGVDRDLYRNRDLYRDRDLYSLHCIAVYNLITTAKMEYYSDFISACGTDQTELFSYLLTKRVIELKL